MQVTLANMRSAVKGWLKEERATKEQTLQLLDVIYAGAIDGGMYTGNRLRGSLRSRVIFELLERVLMAESDYLSSEIPDECGCLIETLEVIRGVRPTHAFTGASAEAFALAKKIPYGATPENNSWSRAARDGILDYYAEKGWR